MTRDEQRKACIEAMAIDILHYEVEHEEKSPNKFAQDAAIEKAAAAFDSLHGIARVVPLEATRKMIEAAYRAPLKYGDGPEVHWRAMSAAGDLTNPPEKKT